MLKTVHHVLRALACGGAIAVFTAAHAAPGDPLSPPVAVDLSRASSSSAPYHSASAPSIGVDDVGNAVLTWIRSDGDLQTPSTQHVSFVGQRFAKDGARIGNEFTVFSKDYVDNLEPNVTGFKLASNYNGTFVATWLIDHTLYYRAYDVGGAPLTNATVLKNNLVSNDSPTVAVSSDGTFAVGWTELTNYNFRGTVVQSSSSAKVQRFTAQGKRDGLPITLYTVRTTAISANQSLAVSGIDLGYDTRHFLSAVWSVRDGSGSVQQVFLSTYDDQGHAMGARLSKPTPIVTNGLASGLTIDGADIRQIGVAKNAGEFAVIRFNQEGQPLGDAVQIQGLPTNPQTTFLGTGNIPGKYVLRITKLVTKTNNGVGFTLEPRALFQYRSYDDSLLNTPSPFSLDGTTPAPASCSQALSNGRVLAQACEVVSTQPNSSTAGVYFQRLSAQ